MYPSISLFARFCLTPYVVSTQFIMCENQFKEYHSADCLSNNFERLAVAPKSPLCFLSIPPGMGVTGRPLFMAYLRPSLRGPRN